LDSTILCRRLAADRNGAVLNQTHPIPVRFDAGSGRYYAGSVTGKVFFDLERQCLAGPLPGHAGDTVDVRLPVHPAHHVRASHLFADAEPLQVCQGRVHSRRRTARKVREKRPASCAPPWMKMVSSTLEMDNGLFGRGGHHHLMLSSSLGSMCIRVLWWRAFSSALQVVDRQRRREPLAL
jgi:hypothetical protein